MQSQNNTLKSHAINGALYETISRYGEAGEEFLKGLRGVDRTTGQVFDRSLLDVSNYKINEQFRDNNIKQQAGFSAEIASTSHKNAHNIINGKANRYIRSEDLVHYGKNNNTVDIVELLDGSEISTSQMKFVSNTEGLLKKIACGDGGGKNDLSRYLNVDKLEVPTEQVEHMKATCREKAKTLQNQADRLRQKGDFEKANKLAKHAENYQKLESKITDSGLTTDKAIAYRLNPSLQTAKDIVSISHEAGIAGAKIGAAVGGTISVISNLIAVKSGDKKFGQAVVDSTKDTLVSAGVGYGTAFAGTAIKTYMSQASSQSVRALSHTGLPAAIVSLCLSMSKTIHRYAKGDISERELFEEVGVTGAGLLSSSMFTMLGQIAIPIPVLGGLIGGMVGYALTNTFYQSFFVVLKEAKIAKERRIMLEMQCEALKAISSMYQTEVKRIFDTKLKELDDKSKMMFLALDNPNIGIDEFCDKMNEFGQFLGKDLPIKNLKELDDVMLSDDVLVI